MLKVLLLAVLLLPSLAYAQAEEPLIGRPIACLNAYSMGTFSEALIECALAAHQGNAEAMSFMGGMYYKGQGVKQSYTEAFNWYTQAADRGWADAQFSLGKMYEKGYGVTQDYDKAFDFYKRAAAQDHLYAVYNIGYFYGKGWVGGKADYDQAAKWFLKSADRRHAMGMYAMGTLHIVGKGVEQDTMKALMWTKLSEKYGAPGAGEAAQKLMKLLSPEDIAAVGKMVDEWEKAHP